MQVHTTRGLVEFSELEVSDSVELGDNHRKITTIYLMGGEVVRQDVVVNVLRPFRDEATVGKVG